MRAMSALEKIEEGLKSAEIEITPEMIEAGVSALMEYYMPICERESMADESAVASVFRRMLDARKSSEIIR